jgi:hypothetical protein
VSAPTLDREEITERVRRVLAMAAAAGEKPPGRPTLVRLTGATDHQVKVALAKLDTAGDSEPPAPASEPAAVTSEHLAPVVQDSGEPVPGEDLADAGDELADAGGDLAPAGEGLAVGLHQPPPASASAGGGLTSPPPAGGKPPQVVAWCGFVFGSVVSVAANVLAARIPPRDAPAGWSPRLDAQVGAAVWPVALLLSVEVLSRIPWPDGWLWKLARYGGVGLVAAGSAVISYQHIRDVLVSWGYPVLSAGVGPLVVDGLMTASGFALLAIAGGGRAKPTTSHHQPSTNAGDAGEAGGEAGDQR